MSTQFPPSLLDLVARFAEHRASYLTGVYNETQVRREYVDPLFQALGWDVENRAGLAEAYKPVIHEDVLRVGASTKAPDYSFRIGGTRKFFVEAKKPSVVIKDDPLPAYQLRRYAWSAGLPLSIVTDFDEFAVYDCRAKPNPKDSASKHRLFYCTFREYEKHWDWLFGHFSPRAIERGAYDRLAGEVKGRRGTSTVDNEFLRQMEHWRDQLAKNIALRNPQLTVEELNFAVQATLDRIVFLRFCEDRSTEPAWSLHGATEGKGIYSKIVAHFRAADEKYNSGLFHFRNDGVRASVPDTLSPTLAIDDKVLKEVVTGLYPPESPYAFDVMPAEILGQVYERFLGKVIRLTEGHRAKVEEKPEVRKAGGVFYTPAYIVRAIVREAVGPLLDACKTPKEALSLKIVDPSCGSGSFLLGAYQFLLDWHRLWYETNNPESYAKKRHPAIAQAPGGGWRLTIAERKRIMTTCLYGVDIDPQAVEVTKLSLLLEVLAGETQETLGQQLKLFQERALPDLDHNIQCGNALIGPEFFKGGLFDETNEDRRRVNAFEWRLAFPEVFRSARGGFDAVVGNPPYVLLQDVFRDDRQIQFFRQMFQVASYKLDLYHLFIERSLFLARPGGRCSMITPSNFISNQNLAKLRHFLLDNSAIEKLIVIEGGVFKGASVDNAIFVLAAHQATQASFQITHAIAEGGALVVLREEQLQVNRVRANASCLFTGPSKAESHAIWEKVVRQSRLLGEIADVNFGKQLRDRKVYTEDVITIANLDLCPDGYEPCYTGSDVHRYKLEWKQLACLTSTEARMGGCWDSAKHAAKDKLLTRQIGRMPQFAIDPFGWSCLNTIFMVNPKVADLDSRFLLGLLNSRLLTAYWIEFFFDRRRTFPKIKGGFLKLLPIRLGDTDHTKGGPLHDRIIMLVGRLLTLYRKIGENLVPPQRVRLEREIVSAESEVDQVVYQLYGLTPKEIAVVENVLTVESPVLSLSGSGTAE